jgi:hypothetical protein
MPYTYIMYVLEEQCLIFFHDVMYSPDIQLVTTCRAEHSDSSYLSGIKLLFCSTESTPTVEVYCHACRRIFVIVRWLCQSTLYA